MAKARRLAQLQLQTLSDVPGEREEALAMLQRIADGIEPEVCKGERLGAKEALAMVTDDPPLERPTADAPAFDTSEPTDEPTDDQAWALARELLTARWTAQMDESEESDAALVAAMDRATESPAVAVMVIERLCQLVLGLAFAEARASGVATDEALPRLFRLIETLRPPSHE